MFQKILGRIINGFMTSNEWKSKGVPEEDIRRDIKVLMPSLDLFGKTK